MTTLIYLQIPVPEPIPGDPVPVPDPIPRPQPMPDPPPDEEPIKSRIDCDRFFYPECFASRPTHEP
ncbi:hypothetical protein [Escherichia coli]|uniref:proline-rich small protein YnaL n=1 Tax=Escherichia coli TaxID=562 RepID=UPI0029C164BF|nr:hypothetical protein [Escherichia coli]MDX5673428.1 hypothetical protein [Escherichia coli]